MASVTGELNSKFNSILVNISLNSHMRLVINVCTGQYSSRVRKVEADIGCDLKNEKVLCSSRPQ